MSLSKKVSQKLGFKCGTPEVLKGASISALPRAKATAGHGWQHELAEDTISTCQGIAFNDAQTFPLIAPASRFEKPSNEKSRALKITEARRCLPLGSSWGFCSGSNFPYDSAEVWPSHAFADLCAWTRLRAVNM